MNTVFPEIAITADARQVGGSHYRDMQMQPWDVMQAVLTPEEFRGFLKGNVIKYAMRQGKKEGTDDAGKAQHYAQKLAEVDAQEGRRNGWTHHHEPVQRPAGPPGHQDSMGTCQGLARCWWAAPGA
jgi:hypothetical protein